MFKDMHLQEDAQTQITPEISKLIQSIDAARQMALSIPKDADALTAAHNLNYVIKRLNGTTAAPETRMPTKRPVSKGNGYGSF